MLKQLINSIVRNGMNIPGKRLKGRFLVFESDDWGSIRTPSIEAISSLESRGVPFRSLPIKEFSLFDTLESNSDLNGLYDVLSKYRDIQGHPVVFTLIGNGANPDYEKIRENGFSRYEYEPYTKTLDRYSNRDRVHQLHRKAIDEGLAFPSFHGREHLNVCRWMRLLQANNTSAHLLFDHGVCNYSFGINSEDLGELAAAFDIEFEQDIEYQKNVIKDGLNLFEKLWGFKSQYFVPPNGPYSQNLNFTTKECGITGLYAARIQRMPLGNGQIQKRYNWMGTRNQEGLIYINRNGFFEPTYMPDPIDNALLAIERAFRWHKPAVISSHRVNYCGELSPENRSNSLKLLDELLKKVLQRWPDIQFIHSENLINLYK